jgi:glycosyltransferase involved in cell wall biosynthesis
MTLLLVVLHAMQFGVCLLNVWYLRRRLPAPGGEIAPTVTVFIPARNEAENLRRLLPSLWKQMYPRFDVVVYDDASTDGTADVLRELASPRMRTIRGEGPPPGWIGKVHALYQATRDATADLFLFLDADVELLHPGVVRRLVDRYLVLPPPGVLTVLPRYRGGGMLLVSLLPNALLATLPWPLVGRLRSRALAALNGQCWMIDANLYRQFEPHRAVRQEILEDVKIGRYLKRNGVIPALADATQDIAVEMYPSFSAAWTGFRKNTYLLFGGSPARFLPMFGLYTLLFLAAPFIAGWMIGLVYLSKAATDRVAGVPLTISLCAPLSYLLGAILQIDSFVAHLRGNVSWKGRRV